MLSYSALLERRPASYTNRSRCARRTSSPGHSSAPPPTYPTRRFLPPHPEGLGFGCLAPTRHHVPPPWCLSTVTVCSARQPQVYCNLVPAMGFIAFPPSPNPSARQVSIALALSGGFPATRFIPLDEFPSSTAVPHHCGLCPLAVTTCSVSAFPRAPKNVLRTTLRFHRSKPVSARTLRPKPDPAWRVATGQPFSPSPKRCPE